MWGRPKVVGFAKTIEFEPLTGEHGGAHILTGTIAEAGLHDVLVVANGGRTDVSSWGGIVSVGASLRGVRGVITDGACRDVGQARALGFPVYARAQVPATARGRLRQRSSGEPVALGDVTVHSGDLLLADEGGVVVVPREWTRDVCDQQGQRTQPSFAGEMYLAGQPAPGPPESFVGAVLSGRRTFPGHGASSCLPRRRADERGRKSSPRSPCSSRTGLPHRRRPERLAGCPPTYRPPTSVCAARGRGCR